MEDLYPIKDFEDYLIDYNGNIYSTKRNIYLKQKTDKYGYKKVNLSKDGKIYSLSIHRLVALNFIENLNPDLYIQVNHKDGNKLNNSVYNLEWVTPRENTIHTILNGLSGSIGESNHNAKLTNEDVIDIRNMYNNGKRIYEINKKYSNVSWNEIKYIVTYKVFNNI